MTEDTRDVSKTECDLIVALERVPEISVPADFAARCAGAISTERRALAHSTRARASVGQSVALACSVTLLAALLWLALHTQSSDPLMLGLMYVVCAEMVGILLWLTIARRSTD